jgi:hypothetical protein
MKFKQFKELIDRIYKEKLNDFDVIIALDEISIGGIASTNVDQIYQGIDWDMNKIIITSEKPIIKKDNSRDIPVKIKHDLSISSKVICPICNEYVSKSDNYCKHCGQALTFESKHK